MHVDNTIDAFMALLHFDKPGDRTQIIAEVKIAGGCTPEKTRGVAGCPLIDQILK